jgi:uncharacterized protein (DUF433 family)
MTRRGQIEQDPNGAWYVSLTVLYNRQEDAKMTLDRITIDPMRMNGQPCVRNMRLTVRRVVELAALYPNREDLHREFPDLDDEDIRQALVYAAAHLEDRILEVPFGHETAA